MTETQQNRRESDRKSFSPAVRRLADDLERREHDVEFYDVIALGGLAKALDLDELAEILVPVVYAQHPAHYEDSEEFVRVKPWGWLTEGYQEHIRAEAREYAGTIRSALLDVPAEATR